MDTVADLPVYGLDIETDTSVDGLDPAVSPVVAVAVVSAEHQHVVLGPEPELLAAVDRLLSRLPPGLLVTWNGAGFDLPFLADRSRLAGVPLSLRLWADPALGGRDSSLPGHRERYRATWFGHRHLDGYRLYRADVGRTLGLSCGLKPLARLVGLHPVEVDRGRIHQLGREELRAYVASDAHLARQLVLRRLPAAARFADPAGPPPAGEGSPAVVEPRCRTVTAD